MYNDSIRQEQASEMTDVFTPEKRSEIMSRIRSTNTKPELIVRRCLHSMGYRFRLHRRDLPGKPDIVLPKHNTVILVNGCFWHGHTGCKTPCRIPATNTEFWTEKITRNKARDIKNRRDLRKLGWKVITIWECWTKDTDKLMQRLEKMLKD
jgi:DNA mismatch endonuclease, patch repair protein